MVSLFKVLLVYKTPKILANVKYVREMKQEKIFFDT